MSGVVRADGEHADVLCAVRGPVEERLAAAFAGPRGAVRIVRRCADVTELLAAADAGAGTVALFSADQPGADRQLVARLRDAGLAVVALAESGRPWLAERMHALGVDAVVAEDVDVEALAALLLDPGAADATGHGDGTGREAEGSGQSRLGIADGDPAGPGPAGYDETATGPAGHGPAEPEHAAFAPAGLGPGAGDGPRRGSLPPGRIVVVWGPGGAPGRTSVAINLATEIAARPEGGARDARLPDVLLVDADTHHPGLVQHLGLLDESAGLAVCARAASQGRLDAGTLAANAPRLDERLRVLTGIGRPDRWPEAPGPSLEVVWERAREIADLVVVDCGAPVEQDEALSYDTRAPQRNAATISALAAADVVVAVGAPDPVGVHRLVRALGELDEGALAPGAHLVVVLNRVRAAVVGPRPTAVLSEALARYAGVQVSGFVPDDPAAFDAAILTGRTLAEVAPHAPARRAIADMARLVAPSAARATAGG